VFGSATEAFSQKNIACSVEESLERFRKVMNAAKYVGVKVRGYVPALSTAPHRRPWCFCLVSAPPRRCEEAFGTTCCEQRALSRDKP
jgi:isopropylmalate/homocitrate/citramalate synthase